MLMQKNPLFSVVIPTINEEKYLPYCLSSFKKQTFKDFEIIVSDGDSTDKTVQIAKKSGAKVVANKGSNVTEARQSGIEISKGKIIVGADADTTYPPDHLKRIIADFKTDKKIVAVGGGGIFEKKPLSIYWFWKTTYLILEKIFQIFKTALYIPAFNLSFKRDFFFKIGGYNTYLDFGGDELDILARLKKQGKVYFDPQLKVYPSSRRAKEGFFRLIVKHSLIDYYLGYFLAKIFKKTIIKGKPVR